MFDLTLFNVQLFIKYSNAYISSRSCTMKIGIHIYLYIPTGICRDVILHTENRYGDYISNPINMWTSIKGNTLHSFPVTYVLVESNIIEDVD